MTGRTPRPLLEPAYRRTLYRVLAPAGAIDLRIGHRCPALDRLLAAGGYHRWAFLTAWNPQSRPLPVWRNAMRSRHLARTLRALGWRFLPGLGIPCEPGWRPEVSVLVPGMPAARALRIARSFGQYAIVAGRRDGPGQLLWCRE